jgi:hypothetical protein
MKNFKKKGKIRKSKNERGEMELGAFLQMKMRK